MSDEMIFRIILAVVLVVLIVWYRIKVSKRIAREKALKNAQLDSSDQRAEVSEASRDINAQPGLSPAVVAAITAAICVMTGKSAEQFKYTAIRRLANNNVWSLVGATDLMSNRQRFTERGSK
ncbi:MAG: hypothetical protein ACOX7U_01560 [Desulfitobacteriia bacterium]|jgi:chorismate mutase